MKKNLFSNIKFKKPKPAAIVTTVVLVVVIIGLLYINSHPPIRHSILKFFNSDYTPVAHQMRIKDTEASSFERIDDKVMIMSGEGVIRADKKLNTKLFAAQSGSKPQLKSQKDKYIQFFSDAKTVFVGDTDKARDLKCANNVICATINKNGYYAIATEEKGYKALITVYNNKDEEIYKWHSADNFILGLSLSPDNKTLAASMMNFGNEKQKNLLSVFKFSEAKPISVTEVNVNYIAEIKYYSSGKILVIGSEEIMMYSTKGEKLWNVSYNGEKMVDYSINDKYIAVANLSSSALLGRYIVNIYDYGGRKIAEYDNSEDIINIDCAGDTILITNKKSIRVITKKGVETNNIKFAKDVKQGLLFGDTGYAAIVTGNVLHSVKID